MNTFYSVMLSAFLAGMIILCCAAPWTSTPPGTPGGHNSLGYAAVWSQQFATVPGARVDPGPFAVLGAVVAFFAIVLGAAAYFFSDKRGPEKDLDDD